MTLKKISPSVETERLLTIACHMKFLGLLFLICKPDTQDLFTNRRFNYFFAVVSTVAAVVSTVAAAVSTVAAAVSTVAAVVSAAASLFSPAQDANTPKAKTNKNFLGLFWVTFKRQTY